MSISKVRAKFNGTWYTLTKNTSTGLYEGTITPSSVGTYYIGLEATNSTGVVATVSGTAMPALKLVVQDKTKPVLTVSSPTNGLVTKASSVTVSGTVTDNVGVTSLTVNGTSTTVGSGGSFSRSVSLSTGSNTITVIAKDAAGNTTTVTRTVTRDVTGPTVTWTAPANGLVTSASSVTVSGKATDANGVKSITVNGTIVTIASDGAFSRSVSLSAGSNTITIVATDTPGNTTTTSRTVTRATAGPTLNITAPSAGSVLRATSVTVRGTVSDSVSTVSSVTVNGTAVTVSGGSFSRSVSLSEGSNTITVVAKNAVGLSTTKTVTVIRDMTGPTISITSPANGLVTAAASITVSGKATDTHGIKSVTVNGTSVTVASDGSFSRSVSLSGGANTITIVATDTPGNTTTTSRSVTRATSGPSLTITSPTAGAVLRATSVTVTGSVSDSVSPVSGVTVNGVNATVSNGTYSASVPLAEGSNTLTVVAKSQVNLSTTATRNVVRDMTAPSLSVTAPSNNLITSAASVTVSGTVSDAHLSGVTVNGTKVTVSGGNWSTAASLSAGSNTITVVASDTVGNSSTVTRTVKRETQGPNLTITSPAAGYLTKNSTVTVTGTVSANISPVKSVTVNGAAASISGSTYTASVALAEGDNTITVIGTNQVNLTTTKTVSVTRDSTPPVISLTKPTAGQIVKDVSFTVTGTVSDDRSGVSNVTVNGGSAAVNGGTFSRTITLSEGDNAVTAVAADQAGNTASVTGSVELDTIPPELAVTYPAGDIYTNQPLLTVTGTASDKNLVSVTVNGMVATMSGGNYAKSLTLEEGVNIITASAYDRVGHVTTITRSVHLDTQQPVLTLVSPAEGWLTVNRPTVIFEATDEPGGSGVDLSTAEILLDGVRQTSGVSTGSGLITYTPAAAIPEGRHVVTARVRDRAGNQRGLSASYGIDTIPPELHIRTPDSHRIVDVDTFIVAGVALDDGSGVASVDVVGEDGQRHWGTPGEFSVAVPLEIGVNHLTVTARDEAGWETAKSFEMLRLVTDRTQWDADKVLELCTRGYENWTVSERVWWKTTKCRRGSYDALDLNRVTTAMDWISGWLDSYGYGNSYQEEPHRPWTEQDDMTVPQGERYIQNVEAMRESFPLPEGVPETPWDLEALEIQEANGIEKILVAVDAVRPRIDESAWYSGEIFCGEA